MKWWQYFLLTVLAVLIALGIIGGVGYLVFLNWWNTPLGEHMALNIPNESLIASDYKDYWEYIKLFGVVGLGLLIYLCSIETIRLIRNK